MNQSQLDQSLKNMRNALKKLTEANDTISGLLNRIDVLESDITNKNSMIIDIIYMLENGQISDVEELKKLLVDILYDVPVTKELSE